MKQFRQIAAGVDLANDGKSVSASSRRAVLQAQWIAEQAGATLTLVHSTWFEMHPDEGGEAMAPGPSEEGLKALEEFARGCDSEAVPVTLEVVSGKPSVELIQRVLRGQCDLVVAGRNEQRGAHLFGSTSKSLLRNCPCPVWITRPDSDLTMDVVLAATDLTPVGDRAVDLGTTVARLYGVPMHVVHAWQTPMDVQMDDSEESNARRAEFQAAAEEEIRGVLERVAPGQEVGVHVTCDSPSHLILRGVEELGADLLVMGTVSRGGIPGFLVGNTAERLLKSVSCAVLAIKPADFVCPIELPAEDGA